MPRTISNLELNSYLTKLTEIWDAQAAQAIIDNFHDIPIHSQKWKAVIERGKNDSTIGHTSEIGNVSIDDAEVETKIYGDKEVEVIRIGQFKIERREEHDKLFIVFYNFWASDISTRSSTDEYPPEFWLRYDESTLEPLSLAQIDFVFIESMSDLFLQPLTVILVVILGKIMAFLTGGSMGYRASQISMIYDGNEEST